MTRGNLNFHTAEAANLPERHQTAAIPDLPVWAATWWGNRDALARGHIGLVRTFNNPREEVEAQTGIITLLKLAIDHDGPLPGVLAHRQTALFLDLGNDDPDTIRSHVDFAYLGVVGVTAAHGWRWLEPILRQRRSRGGVTFVAMPSAHPNLVDTQAWTGPATAS